LLRFLRKKNLGGGEHMKKSETAKQTENLDNNILVGYVRRSNAGGALKLSINTAAFADCSTYMTSDGQSYVPLVISMGALQKVLSGERAVTTVTQLHD
jgi:hypothetical protein